MMPLYNNQNFNNEISNLLTLIIFEWIQLRQRKKHTFLIKLKTKTNKLELKIKPIRKKKKKKRYVMGDVMELFFRAIIIFDRFSQGMGKKIK